MSIPGQQESVGVVDTHSHHVHWNDLLPYTVETGDSELEVLCKEIEKCTQEVDLVALSCCAIRLEQ